MRNQLVTHCQPENRLQFPLARLAAARGNLIPGINDGSAERQDGPAVRWALRL